ncbi:FKBP-type peptidyl-prolyl cis-trans isomerase [Lentzea xinjiangensis]|uniref:Peptidyl-prolyl cis-trans isomerase n=1 Tax=Lentzea xinjiangensis TaxID=402600 RepID=A0A1H9U7C2_9PSEU|nr:FKBP-type peptidyl-prolyl cis-trans isomerase [Lentzea xinjiangensis]SES05047.1 FKBP-type peptidyl-prolyl cis-trans isomerase [Lentzea xinjiangensis]
MRNVLLIASLALAAATGLAGCGSSAQPSAGSSTAPTTPCKADDFKVTGDFGAAPKVEIPACKPTDELVVKDLVQGTGAEVKAGTTATVNYQLTTFSDKKVLDSSFGKKPFDVENVGQAPVIDGWNEGIVGLKENGRRLLVVPPAKGYGQGGQGIKPNETLVFVIDGVKVTPAG